MKNKSPFVYVANHLGLDFMNTQFTAGGELTDFLETGDNLRQWAKGLGIHLQEAGSEIDMSEVHGLRTAFRDLCGAKPSNEAFALLNKYIDQYTKPLRLESEGQGYRLVEKAEPISISALLSKLAYETASLLASEKIQHIKHCEHEKCVLMFLDVSKNKKRRWCSMEVCGNRAKASAHYKKKANSKEQ